MKLWKQTVISDISKRYDISQNNYIRLSTRHTNYFKSFRITIFWSVEIQQLKCRQVELKLIKVSIKTKMANSIQNSPQSEMKPYKTIQENFAIIGINRKLLTQSYPFNWRIFITLLELTAGVGFVSMYVIKYANSFIEYTQSIFLGSAGTLVAILLLCIIIKAEKLFEFIDRNEIMINTRKYCKHVR